MPAWNLVLQRQDPSPAGACQRFTVPGIARPCRILFYACDASAISAVLSAYDAVEKELKSRSGIVSTGCFWPRLDCMTWGEPSCSQLLVPVIGGQVSKPVEDFLLKWQRRAGGRSLIVPALLNGVSHSLAFGGCSNAISGLNNANWQGNPVRLASSVIQQALHLEKSGLFISYRRVDAGPLADQLHDAFAQKGFRVFLDRFSGTPGRYFPSELAEEMSDKAVLLVIETQNILQSKWTLWEVAFAHRYQLGLVSLQFPSAPTLSRISARQRIAPTSQGVLKSQDLIRALTFVEREQVIAGLKRRAFYEGLVAGAASSGGGKLNDLGYGPLELLNKSGTRSAIVSPCGRPGRLGDIRSLFSGRGKSLPRLLVGQHRHLPLGAQDDLNWLALQTSVELHDRYSGYRRVRDLC